MAQAKFIQSGSAKGAARVSADLPIGRYAFLALILKGTTDVAQTLDEADVGRIRVQRNGRQIQAESFEFFHDYSNLKGGFPTRTVPTAGASRIVAFIPFSLHGVPNTLDVRSKEEVDVYLDFDAVLNTRFGANAATYELYAYEEAFIPETYELQIEEQDIQAAGAGRLDRMLDGVNVGSIFLRDGASIVNTVQVEVDGRTVVDSIDDAFLLDLTNITNRVEASGMGLLEIPIAPTGIIEEAFNRNAEISLDVSGAGTLEVTKLRVMPSSRAEQSLASVRALIQAKRGAGQSRPRSVPTGAV